MPRKPTYKAWQLGETSVATTRGKRLMEQQTLFAQKPNPSAPSGCPRMPGPLCRDARERAEGCPGAVLCEHWARRPLLVKGIAMCAVCGGDGLGTELATRRECPQCHGKGMAPCEACGSVVGVVLYERGPLAGKRSCWECAKPIVAPATVCDACGSTDDVMRWPDLGPMCRECVEFIGGEFRRPREASDT
jgi:hypothetical protein